MHLRGDAGIRGLGILGIIFDEGLLVFKARVKLYIMPVRKLPSHFLFIFAPHGLYIFLDATGYQVFLELLPLDDLFSFEIDQFIRTLPVSGGSQAYAVPSPQLLGIGDRRFIVRNAVASELRLAM